MIKFKDIINEAKWSDRKWGDSLPTLEDYMIEAGDDDNFVHVGGGRYKEVNKATGKALPNSPTYIKKDGGGYEMVDDDDPRLSKGDDANVGDEPEDEPSGKLGGGDYERDGGEPEDKPFGGDTGKDADFDPDDGEGEPDFYDPEDYEKHYPEKTKPKDDVGGVKYGQGFSADSDHMFDSVADSKRFTYDDEHSPTPSEDKYSGMLDAVKGGDWEKFRAGIHDMEDQDAREHLLNLANHVDSGTYKGEFPSGEKGVKFGRKEVMNLFKQAADYGHEQWGDEEDDEQDDEEAAKAQAFKDMEDEKEETIKVINGKKYKAIKESKKPTLLQESKMEIRKMWDRIK